MKLLIFAALLVAAPAIAQAQQVMDQSDKDFPDVAKTLVKGLVGQVTDPYSAQIIGIRRSMKDKADICGFVNLKNQSGGYAGFQPFLISGGTVLIQGVSNCQ